MFLCSNTNFRIIGLAYFILLFSNSVMAEDCLVPLKKTDKRSEVKLSKDSRKACIEQASLFFEQPNLTADDLYRGDMNNRGFLPDEKLYCRFTFHRKSGSSPKFRCYLTDSNYKYYAKDRNIVSSATITDKEGHLIDYYGHRIYDEDNEKALKADKVRIKYTTGKTRHREVFTEIAATRIFWSLGLYHDSMYPVKVKCLGCSHDPHKERQKYATNSIQGFYPASAERKLPGKEIEIRNNQGWSKRELKKKYHNSGESTKIEIEAFVLATNLFNYHNPLWFQNRITCLKGHYNKLTGVCDKPVLYIQDLGSTFGSDELFVNPRGDYSKWQDKGIFKDRSSCKVRGNFGKIKYISEEARSFLMQRLNALTEDKVRAIFDAAHFELVDEELREEVSKQYPNLRGPELDRMVINKWVYTFMDRIKEIDSVRCPNLEKSSRKNR